MYSRFGITGSNRDDHGFYGSSSEITGTAADKPLPDARRRDVQSVAVQARADNGLWHDIEHQSDGILFTTEEMLPVGRTVELSVNWPARLDGTCALKFVAVGRVVRSEASQAVARIERYQFKTRGTSLKAAAARAGLTGPEISCSRT
jgi:hypothetical protein